MNHSNSDHANRKGLGQRFLDVIEWLGNKLPDPAFLFLFALLTTWVVSAWLAPMQFSEIDPRDQKPVTIISQLSSESLVNWLSSMVKIYIDFPPLGVVLVALLGVGVAEQTGFIQSLLKSLLIWTPRRFITPMVMLVAIMSHVAGDSGYVLIIPLGAVMFAAAGRHPLLGITTTFAGVAGGFSACFVPTSLDPLLQGFTLGAARMIDPSITVNPLCNLAFMGASCGIIVLVGWWVTDRVIEPRVAKMTLDGEYSLSSGLQELTKVEIRGLIAALTALAVGMAILAAWALPLDSPWRSATGRSLIDKDAPMMKAIVPFIFLFFLVPGVVYGYVVGTVKSHRDIVQGMSKSMGSIAYYMVMVFFASQFTYAFAQSNVGILLAIKGANTLAAWQLPSQFTVIGVILITTTVNLLIGSASAKWALLSPILVPMLMRLGLSPELTQAAYRIGDSSTNIVTPLMPYFPLIVTYCQRYVKSTGIGTLVSLMLPYSIAFLVSWSVFLMIYWSLGLPLGVEATYGYPR